MCSLRVQAIVFWPISRYRSASDIVNKTCFIDYYSKPFNAYSYRVWSSEWDLHLDRGARHQLGPRTPCLNVINDCWYR